MKLAMTKAEILKQIEELKKQIEALPEDEKKIRTMPNNGERFICSSSDLHCFAAKYPYGFDKDLTKGNSSIGNYFKSYEDAKMVIRAMKLEHAIRIRRIELNAGWEPNWDDTDDGKYYVYITVGGCLTVYKAFSDNFLPVWGYYKSKEIAQQIIDEFKDDLLWYFTEYYQNKDKMYVWGGTEND